MSREWQQMKYQAYVLPHAVYYQCIWAVRDLERMENRLQELREEEGSQCGTSIVSDSGGNFVLRRPTEERALEKAILEERIQGIRAALDTVPEAYRSFILSNIILKNSGKSFPNKMWKYWKQRFIHTVAKNLQMI
ncbi:MAG: hypothetical protein U0M21_02720 [Emergencia sp.]|nr:hypothetical protein [Emergencia sp.]